MKKLRHFEGVMLGHTHLWMKQTHSLKLSLIDFYLSSMSSISQKCLFMPENLEVSLQ